MAGPCFRKEKRKKDKFAADWWGDPLLGRPLGTREEHPPCTEYPRVTQGQLLQTHVQCLPAPFTEPPTPSTAVMTLKRNWSGTTGQPPIPFLQEHRYPSKCSADRKHCRVGKGSLLDLNPAEKGRDGRDGAEMLSPGVWQCDPKGDASSHHQLSQSSQRS